MISSLSECLDAVIDNRGVTPHKRNTEWRDSGIKVLSANNVKTDGLQNMEEIRYIDEDVYPSWMKIPLEKGDIILTSEAPAGEVYYWDSDERVVLGQRLYGLKVKKSINPKYLKYYLQSNVGQKAIYQQQSGSTVMGISAATFPSIKVYLPAREIQDNIANMLYSLDSKIECNKRINAELEALAKTIYDYWFLQFEFPNEEGLPYKSSGGKMVWSEELKREIPEGWGVKNIRTVCDIVDCLHSKKPDYSFEDEKYYLLQLENLTSSGYIDLSEQYFITKDDYLNWTSKIEIQENDFVITNAGRTGAVGMIPAGVRCALGRNFTAIRPTKINPYYLRMFLQSPYMERQVKSNLDSGSFFKSFNVKSIKEVHVLIPEQAILDKASKIFTSLIKRIELQLAENRELAALRDWLLPMLMNGQVGFKDEV